MTRRMRLRPRRTIAEPVASVGMWARCPGLCLRLAREARARPWWSRETGRPTGTRLLGVLAEAGRLMEHARR